MAESDGGFFATTFGELGSGFGSGVDAGVSAVGEGVKQAVDAVSYTADRAMEGTVANSQANLEAEMQQGADAYTATAQGATDFANAVGEAQVNAAEQEVAARQAEMDTAKAGVDATAQAARDVAGDTFSNTGHILTGIGGVGRMLQAFATGEATPDEVNAQTREEHAAVDRMADGIRGNEPSAQSAVSASLAQAVSSMQPSSSGTPDLSFGTEKSAQQQLSAENTFDGLSK